MQEHTPTATVKIGVVMGSDSDWPTLQAAAKLLEEFGVAKTPRRTRFLVKSFVDCGQHGLGRAGISHGESGFVRCKLLQRGVLIL